ncbi:MAG: Gfo/Idh/MocA family oxidoreductase [Kiritimatiellae bacterium]|nr:Gfo/Idh/MocA family oxidoreductase [Kiritimatiellia bacterium]
MNKLTASVVGGGMGGRLSLQALARSSRFELVAVTDMRPAVCAELEPLFPGLRTFTDHAAMFAECPTDVVCVSTWPPSHEPVTMAALELPLRGILVEKPLADTAAAGARILAAIRAKALPMAVPHNLLAKRTPLEVIARVRQGAIGALKLVEIQCRRWDIMNAGIHWLNFFVNLVGEEPLDWVMAICEASTRTFRDGMQVETTAVTYVQARSGIRCVMNTGDDVPLNAEANGTLFRLVGTGGQIEFRGFEHGYRILNTERPAGEWVTPAEFDVTGHQRHLEQMADRIETGTPDYRIPESSLRALEICEGAYLSSRHRCKVTFPFDAFTVPAEPDWDPGRPYSGEGGGRDGRRLDG